MVDESPLTERSPLREIARLFFVLGIIGFGGPAAHIAMMRDEVVRRRRWLSDKEFLEDVGLMNLIPGPNSTELAMHIGRRRGGRWGLVVAGVCFIVPAVLIVSALAWLYREHGTDPAVVDIRYGVLPVVVAIVLHALVGLSRTALVSAFPCVLAVSALVGYASGIHELVILAAAGVASVVRNVRPRPTGGALGVMLAPLVAHEDATRSLWRLFREFLEIGSVLYGSGYVLVAFLRSRFVDDLGWLTDGQLLDAVAVGQVTPGPVFTTATFVGWQVHGAAGAVVSTVGIFAPSFLFVALLGRFVPWVRTHDKARDFLSGVTAASLGLMAGVLVDIVRVAVVDAITLIVVVAALTVLMRTRVNSLWLVLCGAGIGVVHLIGGW